MSNELISPYSRNPTPAIMDPVAKPTLNTAGLPRLRLNLHDHKIPIAINWSIIIFSSGILPIVGYFALHYATTLPLKIILSPWLGLMGATSVFALLKRSWSLVKKDSTCRPLGMTGRWGLDYFGWNFLFGFVMLTVIISLGISLENLTVVSLPLSILVLYVCLELLLASVAMKLGIRAPFRFSSLARGEAVRPGVYVVVEDVVAVDGGQGQEFRRAWGARYEASPAMRTFLARMDLLWGVSGLAVVAVVWGVVLGLANEEVGYAIGWTLPWVWAGTMAALTTRLAKSMLRREAETHVVSVPV